MGVLPDLVASLLVALGSAVAPVPKDNAVPVAPPPRPLIRFHALQFVTKPNRPHEGTVRYGEFDTSGPIKKTFVTVPRKLRQVALDPTSRFLYGIASQEVGVVPPGAPDQASINDLYLPEDVTKLSWPCGITFDTKRDRLIVVSLGGKGHMYAYTPKTNKWAVLTDMDNLDLAALTYSPRADALYGLYESKKRPPTGARNPTIGVFDPATGRLMDEITLDSPTMPKGFGAFDPALAPTQMASVGEHIIILTETQMFRLDLKTKKLTQEWKK